MWLKKLRVLNLFNLLTLNYFQDRPQIIISDTFLRNVNSQSYKTHEQDSGEPTPQRLQILELKDINFKQICSIELFRVRILPVTYLASVLVPVN